MGTKRLTIHLDETLFERLRLKAVEANLSISDLVRDAARQSLEEEAGDLAAFDERSAEQDLPFERVVKKLRSRGKL